MSKKTMNPQLLRASLAIWEGLDTPVSLSCHLLARNGEWRQLLTKTVSPHNYIDSATGADRFKRDAQAVGLLSKYADLDIGIDRKEVARESFFKAERLCKLTNERLLPYVFPLHDDGETVRHPRIEHFVRRVQGIVAAILGAIPDFEQLHPRFGPGVVSEGREPGFVRARRSGVLLGDKLTNMPWVTKEAKALLAPLFWPSAWGRELLRSDGSDMQILRGNRFTTVPKSAKTDRGICIEPGGNVYLQLALGGFIRRRLSRFGIDLERGQSIHRSLARESSLTGRLATIDLSSASDTVSYRLVQLLLPDAWHDLLSALRSPVTEIDGKHVRLEKFSSMGNGFTFELETLIFAAITAACQNSGIRSLGQDVFVYGDDILTPAANSEEVLSALRFFGFVPNTAKTFVSGPFKESCGGDYFQGVDVRPHQVKESPDEPTAWITLANGLHRRWFDHRMQSRLYRARERVLGFIPTHLRRCGGPVELGDAVIASHDVNDWTIKVRHGIRYIRACVAQSPHVPWEKYPSGTVLSAALYGAPSKGITPRGCIRGYKVTWIAWS